MSSGYLSLSYRSLRAQLDNLFDSVGGAEVLELLDELAKLEEPEQKAVLRAFISIAKEMSEVAADSVGEPDEQSALAIRICDEILRELNPENLRKNHLQVVPGGRTPSRSNKVISLDRSFDPEPPPFKPVA